MEQQHALDAFGALSQETRLAAFRLLVKAGKAGLPAGEIATALAVPGSTLSTHLGVLERARLVRSWRVQRNIFYAVEFAGVQRLLAFLMEDCCQRRAELVGDVARRVAKACC